MKENDKIEEMELSEFADNTVDSIESDEGESTDESIKEKPLKPLTKNEEAKKLIKDSTNIISEADSAVQSVKNVVVEDVSLFEKSKSNLLNSTFAQSQVLLDRVSYEYSEKEQDEPFEISLGEVADSVKVSNIKSGAFTGFLLSIFALIGTALAWLFVASSKVGVELNPEQIPATADLNTIFTWIGGGITGGDGNPMFGQVIVGVTAIIVAWIVYKVRVSTKENKNIRVASETLEKSNQYAQIQQESKTEMEKIAEHIRSATATIDDYQVLLNEQNAKLERVVHVEGIKEDNSEYHSSSKDIMQDSEELMRRVEDLISVPVTKDGKVNENSTFALMEAKALYDSYISKLYA